MKVIKKSNMLDGTLIQIEDWRKDFLNIKTLQIATYPEGHICLEHLKEYFENRKKDEFYLSLSDSE